MVRIEGTEEATIEGEEGTIYEIRVLGVSQTGAEAHARGALAGRFPVNIGRLEVMRTEKKSSGIPGIDAYMVEVFMPHNNPSNEERVY